MIDLPKRTLQIIFAALIAAALILLAYQWQWRTTDVPAELLDMPRVQFVAGLQVRSMLDAMHTRSVAPNESEIAEFAGARGTATLYVSRYGDEHLPRLQWKQMTERVKENRSVFRFVQEEAVGDCRISVCTGMGQTHYFFAADQSLFWLAVHHPQEDSVLQALLTSVAR